MVLRCLFGLAAVALPFVGCGPDQKPSLPCEGPTFNLVLRAPSGPLPADTRLLVKYGGNNDGEAYELGTAPQPQVVFCSEEASAPGGNTAATPGAGGVAATDPTDLAGGAAGEAGARGLPEDGVQALKCRLYTQGPARLDVTASGYEPILEHDLTLGKVRCAVDVEVVLTPLLDAGS